ncbi:MAG TPA: helix-hairpin-helix domain-containing protein [Sphingobacterium sp.]|nr:helix-hairpin-helix domain-containing protein [Sphingobacterium sp.]
MMKRFFDYYSFSKVEQRGFFALVLLIFLIIMFQFLYDYFGQNRLIGHSITYFSDLPSDEPESDLVAEYSTTNAYEHRAAKKAAISYFPFDPNGLPAEKWEEMGFSPKQVAVIKNYEAKGGRFYKKEDVAKVYVISEKDYKRIAPYIVIENKREEPKPRESTFVPKERETKADFAVLDVNIADTTDFKKLRGIGSVLAARAVRYREALGGFHDVAQIGEVYGISSEVFEDIRPFLKVENGVIVKRNINTASQEELSRHPYISKKQAQLIVNYRNQHGFYVAFSDLRKIHALDEDFLRKIEIYIEL